MKQSSLHQFVESRNATAKLRVWSLIMSFFGDFISPSQSLVSAQSVREILSLLGIEEGAIRTAFSRLTADGWLEREMRGRHSYYRLAERSVEPFAKASGRIYGSVSSQEVMQKVFVVISHDRDQNLADLLDGSETVEIARNVHILSSSKPVPIENLQKYGLLILGTRNASIPEWVKDAIAPKALCEQYRTLLEDLQKLDVSTLDSAAEFAAMRCLLIHEWRRMVLRTPDLPANFFPLDWSGEQCCHEVAHLYHQLSPKAESWLKDTGFDVSVERKQEIEQVRFKNAK